MSKETLKLQNTQGTQHVTDSRPEDSLQNIGKALIFWSTVWGPRTGFQPRSVGSLEEPWEETRPASGPFQEESPSLVSFTYLALR